MAGVDPRQWGQAARLFHAHDGTNFETHALIGFDSLAAYETYRARLRADAESEANFKFARREKFILREYRQFLRQVEG